MSDPLGYYINLDGRPDRRAHMEREFARFGLADAYRRLKATEATPGAIGCYRSHVRALELARNYASPVHILEDDSILSSALPGFLKSRELTELLATYDIVFLDMWVDPYRPVVELYQSAIDRGDHALSLAHAPARVACTSSYIVAPRSVRKVLRLLRQYQDARKAIDVVWDEAAKAGTLAAAVTVPFLTGVDLYIGSVSDIQKIIPRNESGRLIQLRTRFFVDKDRQPAI
jgi:GR25 family glycosyltransferase involved in LPS biosynthesis